MKIKTILGKTPMAKVYGATGDLDIANLRCKLGEDLEGALFFCLHDEKGQGIIEAIQAKQKGAFAIVSEKQLELDIPQIIVPNVRKAMATMASAFYDNAVQDLKVVGITGTNGKTTTTYIIKNILEKAGHSVGLIGTNCNMIKNEVLATSLTTPDPIELHELFYKMREAGCDYVVMEVSAHALYFDKLEGVQFEVGIFTNLSRDHLDFFENFDNYASAKFKLFNPLFTKCAIINSDDEYGRQFAKDTKIERLLTYGTDNPADCFAVDLKLNMQGSSFFINLCDQVEEMRFTIPGRYNVMNSLAAAACTYALCVSMEHIKAGLGDMKGVDGRYNVYHSPHGFDVVVDYAHTPDGLENILKSVRDITRGRIINVFGCGGNRDKTKRPIMGEISGAIANYTIITSDNPRMEDPNTIISEIEKGISNITHNYCKLENRKLAIEYALSIAQKGDTILVLGKGAENYQDIQGTKYHFCDAEVVNECLAKEKDFEVADDLELHG